MARDASGIYVAPVTSFSPAVSGDSATPSGWNTLFADISAEITNSLDRLGRIAMAANLPMGGFKISDIASATLATDVPAYSQIYTVPIGKTFTIAGSTSGVATFQPQATQGTPILTLPTVSGTLVTSAASPLSIDAVTGAASIVIPAITVASRKITRFVASGTFTKDAKTLFAEIICVGGGGAGGGCSVNGGGGGGGGGVTVAQATAAQIGATQTVTIGAGGLGVLTGSGTSGTATSVGTLCVANGGIGGDGAAALGLLSGRAGGAAGSSSATLIMALPGGHGTHGMILSVGTTKGGDGGDAGGYGVGGNGSCSINENDLLQSAGSGYGGGGGGASNLSSGNTTGAPGAPGVAIFIEYLSV